MYKIGQAQVSKYLVKTQEILIHYVLLDYIGDRGRRGCNYMVVGFITTDAFSAYHH